MEFRHLFKQDIPRVCEIENRAFSDPWPEDAFAMLQHYHSYAGLANGHLIGYIMCLNAVDESSIINLAIDPDHQRKGYGSELLAYALDQLRLEGIRKVYLDVRSSNLAAQRLYEKYGFRHLGIRKHYYSNPEEDALVLVREEEAR
jgi:ribosomal-protein-alanine N-acetyltransferase